LKVANVVTSAQSALDTASAIIDSNEAATVEKAVEADSVTDVSKRNRTAFDAKAAGVFFDWLTLTPNSIIPDVVLTNTPLKWVLDARESGMFMLANGNSAAANGVGVDTGTSAGVLVVEPMASIETEDAYTSAAGNRVLRFQSSGGSLAPYNDWPPKKSCYRWRQNVQVEVALEHSGALNTLFGADFGDLIISTGPAGGSKTESRTHRLQWASDTRYAAVLNVSFDVGDGATDIDLELRTDNATTPDTESSFTVVGFNMVGYPNGGGCPITEVEYLRADGTRAYLSSGSTWQDFIGKLQFDNFADPNYSLQAMWDERSVTRSQEAAELLDSYLKYGVLVHGSSVEDASINDKYVDIGLTGILDMANQALYLRSDGPFLGMSRRNFEKAFKMFIDELAFLANISKFDDTMAEYLASGNSQEC
jgi:hypothetical protein